MIDGQQLLASSRAITLVGSRTALISPAVRSPRAKYSGSCCIFSGNGAVATATGHITPALGVLQICGQTRVAEVSVADASTNQQWQTHFIKHCSHEGCSTAKSLLTWQGVLLARVHTNGGTLPYMPVGIPQWHPLPTDLNIQFHCLYSRSVVFSVLILRR